MPSLLTNIATTTALAFSLSPSASASASGVDQSNQLRGHSSSSVDIISAYEHILSLRDFQSVLRTSLDDELDLVAAASSRGSDYDDDHAEARGECRHCHAQEEELGSSRANVRRRRDINDMMPSAHEEDVTDSKEQELWTQLQSHAWTTAKLLSRDTAGSADDSGPLSLVSTNTKQLPRPFLLCSTASRDVYSLFRPEDQKYLHVPSRRASNTDVVDDESDGDSCAILTTTANWAYKAMNKYKDLIVQPLVDVMKIFPGTIDSVNSEVWRVPFTGSQKASSEDGHDVVHQDNTTSSSFFGTSMSSSSNNATAAAQQDWERTLTIDIAPGLLAHSTEDDLLDLVNIIITDVQEMGEVGWVLRQELSSEQPQPWQEEYLSEHSLQDVPSLTEMFSLTSPSTTSSMEELLENDRVLFYNQAFANGLESSHGCASMFSTLLIQPRHRKRGLYSSFDLILNPKDAPPAQDYESSASNVNCVTSFLVGLSVHPSVMSLESNLPRYTGWSTAI